MSSSSNRNLEINKYPYENHLQVRIDNYHHYENHLQQVEEEVVLNDDFIGSKEQSGIKLPKEIFEWKPVIYRNVKCHLAIVIWKSI